jgi:hypothetical protein
MGGATSPKPTATPLRNCFFLLLLTLAAVFLHSYHPYVEDAEIYVPAIKKALDPSLYPHDAHLFTGQTRFSLFPVVTAGLVRFSHLSLPTKYFAEASSINFRRSVKYGLGVLLTSVQFRLQKIGWGQFRIFNRQGRCLEPGLEAGYYSPKISDGRSGG